MKHSCLSQIYICTIRSHPLLCSIPATEFHRRSCNKFSFRQFSLFSRLFGWHRFISHSSCYKTGCALHSSTSFSFPVLCSRLMHIWSCWWNNIQCLLFVRVCLCPNAHVCECVWRFQYVDQMKRE